MTARVRCAIYTRKSTEEGLEQDFNSLDAQREACEAFVKSQRGLGWVALSARYDDGGISGGTMDRPALQTLLTDIDEGKIDLVIVYKVDRLTRSLADFAKIVERFEARGASFVSVTQQFNTSTSMGRLTLNVLLSFAQFEREVTGERIRDKIAASKKKGMWMGGLVPLGYDLVDRKLVINAGEAKTVRTLFRLYLDLGSVNELVAEANNKDLKTKQRHYIDGKQTGGQPFTRGHLYQILANPLYAGQVCHRGQRYAGQHEPIIDSKTFEAVQRQLAGNASQRSAPTNIPSRSLLAGLVFDEAGERLSPTHTNKKGQRYLYYISTRLMNGAANPSGGWRLPAPELERAVVQALSAYLQGGRKLIDALGLRGTKADQQRQILARASKATDVLSDRAVLVSILKRVSLSDQHLTFEINRMGLLRTIAPDIDADVSNEPMTFTVPMRLRRRGVEAKLIIEGPQDRKRKQDSALIAAVARAHVWWQDLAKGTAASINEIAARDKVDASDITRLLPLAFLAPDIVDAILDGREPVSLTMYSLKRLSGLPPDWQQQRQLLGFSG